MGANPEFPVDGEHCWQGGHETTPGTPGSREDTDTVSGGEEGVLFSINFRIASPQVKGRYVGKGMG